MIDEFDSVLKPRHYCDDKIESLDYIRQQLHRHEKKENNIEDLKKLIFYANEKIKELESL